MADDTELDALIVRNIADLEASITRAKDLGVELVDKVCQRISDFASAREWFFVPASDGDIDARFGPRGWLAADGKPGFWFTLGETSPTDEYEETWLAEFAGVGPKGAAIQLLFDQAHLSEAKMRRLLAGDAPALAPLQAAGFNADGCYVVAPLAFDLETIAVAFEQDDFDAALAPLGAVLDRAAGAIGQFDALAGRVRAQAPS